MKSLPQKSKANSIRDLAGVGADLWKGLDPDEYVRKLREEWDERDEMINTIISESRNS